MITSFMFIFRLKVYLRVNFVSVFFGNNVIGVQWYSFKSYYALSVINSWVLQTSPVKTPFVILGQSLIACIFVFHCVDLWNMWKHETEQQKYSHSRNIFVIDGYIFLCYVFCIDFYSFFLQCKCLVWWNKLVIYIQNPFKINSFQFQFKSALRVTI